MSGKVTHQNHLFFLNLKLNFVCFCRCKRIYFNTTLKDIIQCNRFPYDVFIYTCHYVLFWVLVFTYILELGDHILLLKFVVGF